MNHNNETSNLTDKSINHIEGCKCEQCTSALKSDGVFNYKFEALPVIDKPFKLSVMLNDSETVNVTVYGLNQLREIFQKFPVSPIRFLNRKRKKENFISSAVALLDIENGTTADEMRERLEKMGIQYFIYASQNHMKIKHPGEKREKPAIPRLRILLILDRPIASLSEYESLMRGLQHEFPMNDKSTIDGARYYYASPTLLSSKFVGRPIQTQHYANLGQEHNLVKSVYAKSEERRTGIQFRPIRPYKGVLSLRTRHFLSFGTPAGSNWHPEFLWAASDLKGQGYSYDEAIAKLSTVTGHLDDTHDIIQLKWVYCSGQSLEVPYRFPNPNYVPDGKGS